MRIGFYSLYCIMIVFTFIHCNVYAGEGTFNVELLKNVKHVDFKPVLIKKINLTDKTERDVNEAIQMTNFSLSTRGDIFLVINNVLYTCSIDTDAEMKWFFPRIVKSDKIKQLIINQNAVYDPLTGTQPPVDILITISNLDRNIVGWYKLIGTSLEWNCFLQSPQATSLIINETRNVVWANNVSIDSFANTYITAMSEDENHWKTAKFKNDGRFIGCVPSYMVDEKGFYYERTIANGTQDKLIVYDKNEKEIASLSFPDYAQKGHVTGSDWLISNNGIWVEVDLGDNQFALVLFDSTASPAQWISGYSGKGVKNKYFCLDGNFYFNKIITDTATNRSTCEIYKVLLR